MGVGFYSKIRSGENSDAASINDIYQKLKEGIVGFSVADVLEDRIRTLIEPVRIIEVFRLHSSFRPQSDIAEILEDFTLFSRTKISALVLPSVNPLIYTQTVPLSTGLSIDYNNITLRVPSYGTSLALGRARRKNLWLHVRGPFSLSDGDGVFVENQDFGSNYDATDGEFHAIKVSYTLEGFNPAYTVDTTKSGVLAGRSDSVFADGVLVINGEFKAIFNIQVEDGADNNTPAKVLSNIYGISTTEYGLFGNGRIECASRLPMYIT